MSGPARDLWIEIREFHIMNCSLTSGPARDLWIEINQAHRQSQVIPSGPARDLWIEIGRRKRGGMPDMVGSRKGPVD